MGKGFQTCLCLFFLLRNRERVGLKPIVNVSILEGAFRNNT